MIRRRLPRYVSEFADRHGKMHVRFRRKGQADHYFKAIPWTPEFMIEYQACLDGKAAPKIRPGADRTKPGSIDALIAAYYAAPEYLTLSDASKRSYRNILERFRAEHGTKSVATIQRVHIKAIIGQKAATPTAANNLLDRIRVLMAFAVDIGIRPDNPAFGLKGFKVRSEGYHTWSDAEIERFEAHHTADHRALLALALLLYTGQRRSDVVRMGWQHMEQGGIAVSQMKTGTRLLVPIHPRLTEILKTTARENLTFLMTGQGKPFSSAGFGNWFRDRCVEAGLPHCSAHGLRKAAARRLAEAGCTNQQIKSITGHRTDSEVARYTAAASQSILAKQAMASLDEEKSGTENV